GTAPRIGLSALSAAMRLFFENTAVITNNRFAIMQKESIQCHLNQCHRLSYSTRHPFSSTACRSFEMPPYSSINYIT
ncbi:hypothetical protein, partial [Bacillus vallismortis]|uniref:hypothetical protein n=1 Tax=Bacillus vallismortis TaxID=72361 RepID=UPI00227EAD50